MIRSMTIISRTISQVFDILTHSCKGVEIRTFQQVLIPVSPPLNRGGVGHWHHIVVLEPRSDNDLHFAGGQQEVQHGDAAPQRYHHIGGAVVHHL